MKEDISIMNMIAKFVLIFILQNIAMIQTVASLNISVLSKQLVLIIIC